MKSLIIISCVLCAFFPAFAQNDLIDRIAKQAIEIDSLKKVAKAELDSKVMLSKENQYLQDAVKKFRTDLSELEKFRTKKKDIENLLQRKTDSIGLLKVTIAEKEKQIAIEKQTGEQKAREENEKGKNEVFAVLINSYKNRTFDDLLKSSTKQTAQRDLQLIQNPTEVKQILSDVDKYFSAKELLDAKLDAVKLKNVQNQLVQIKQQSALLNKLKDVIGNYQTYNEGFKETIEKLIALDQKKAVYGMSKEVQKRKLDEILGEVSSYIFNYDFDFSDYPYLSNLLVEVIKRKLPNADADISDLSKKL